MQISMAANRTVKYWQLKEMTFDSFLADYIKENHTEETCEEYKQMNKNQKANIKDVGGFVGGKLKSGRRLKKNVVNRWLITIDIDYGTLALITSILDKFNFRITFYSTHSHMPDKPRFRLLIPLDKPVTASEYIIAVNILMRIIGEDYCDKGSNQPERIMYFPSTPADGDFMTGDNHKNNLLDAKAFIKYEIKNTPIDHVQLENIQRRTKIRGADKNGPIGAFCRHYSIQEVIENFIPEIYAGEDDRYTFTKGSTAGGLVIYDNNEECTSFHDTDPLNDQHSHNAFDLLKCHKFNGNMDETLKFVSKLSDVAKELAMEKIEAEYPELHETLEKEKRTPDVDEDGWKSTINNYVIILKSLKLDIRYNEFTLMTEYNKETISDEDYSDIYDIVERKYKIYNREKIRDAVSIVARDDKYNPVKEYLLTLKWDGIKRVDTLLIDYFNSPDNEYTRAVTRKFLCAAVKRIFNPGCDFRYMLVLRGPQEIGKSTFLRMLSKDWFNDSLKLTDTRDKTGPEKMQGSWMIEIPEMSGMKKAELETVKGFLTQRDDKFRPAYGHAVKHCKRHNIFIGTTNENNGYLKDITGNTRFWDIHTPTRLKDDLNVDQIWAEIMTMYEKEDLYLNKKLSEYAQVMQDKQLETDTKYEIMQNYVTCEVPENWDNMTTLARSQFLNSTKQEKEKFFTKGKKTQDRFSAIEIWVDVFGGSVKDLNRQESNQITAMLKKLGFRIPAKKNYQGNRVGAWRVT